MAVLKNSVYYDVLENLSENYLKMSSKYFSDKKLTSFKIGTMLNTWKTVYNKYTEKCCYPSLSDKKKYKYVDIWTRMWHD